jgi:D-inositol-3-phosphate glycosyltransferase
MRLGVAVLSVHTCPLAALGGKETGGMNVYVRELSRELGRMGMAVDVFTRSQNPGIDRVVTLGPCARVIHIPAGPEAPLPHDQVHRHLQEFVERVDEFRRAEGIAYDLIHGHYWLSGVAGLRLRGRWGSPHIQMFHTLGRLKNAATRFYGPGGIGAAGGERAPDLRLDEEERIVAEADRVVVTNPVERAQMVWCYGAGPERIAVIPCGVDTGLFYPMDQAAAKRQLGLRQSPLLLYVGRLTPIKGIETLLEAMRLLTTRGDHRDVALLVVGGDTDEPQNGHVAHLRRRVDELGLGEAVRFLGAQPQNRLRLYYSASHLTVMPSYYESFGMVALEAMACGVPVVASRVGGLAVTVQDGVTGLLVSEGDPLALAGGIARLLADSGLRASLGGEGARWARGFRWSVVATLVCRLYASLDLSGARRFQPACLLK